MEIEPTAIVAEGPGVLAGACLLGMISIKQAAELLSRHALGHRELFAVPEDGGERADGWHCPLIIPGASLHRRQEDAVVRLAGYLQLPQALRAQDLRETTKSDGVVAHFGGSAELRRQFELAHAGIRWVDLGGGEDVITRLLRSFARLYVGGLRFDSRPLAARGSRRAPLPTYPFENKPYRYAQSAGAPVKTAPPAPSPLPPSPPPPPARLAPGHGSALAAGERAALAAALRSELGLLKH
jgi:hypothetical protein